MTINCRSKLCVGGGGGEGCSAPAPVRHRYTSRSISENCVVRISCLSFVTLLSSNVRSPSPINTRNPRKCIIQQFTFSICTLQFFVLIFPLVIADIPLVPEMVRTRLIIAPPNRQKVARSGI